MRPRLQLLAGIVAAAALATGAAFAARPAAADATPAHHPLYMPNLQSLASPALQPPPVTVPPVCVPDPVNGCVGAGVPPAGQPGVVNMAYFGGHVQVAPKIYLVLWGWGEQGAWSHKRGGMPARDPDGAGARMIAFLKAIGGTQWAGVQTQYFQLDPGGWKEHITNPSSQLKGIWWDDTNASHSNLSYQEIAQEAARGAAHFKIKDLKNSQVIVAQPENFEDGQFLTAGYCAWHDYTQPQFYPGVTPGISFTNMPYVLELGTSCGQDSVNAAPGGDLDGFSIVLGHEVEETVTDPGAEDVIDGNSLGGWYDYSGYENGDKCAWVGYTGVPGTAQNVPGGLNNITGNDGKLYPVQSLWSNDSAEGAGYCAGAGDDLPVTG